jgi:hypothetical protein
VFYRDFEILPIVLVLGALAGVLYTVLEPAVRRRPRLHYLPWVLCAYLLIYGGVGVTAVLKHDRESLGFLANPWFIGFVLVAGPVAAYAVARMLEDE